MTSGRILNRELSWLAFNHRVLQEAMDPSVPLFDRLGFLAIFSSNLDEFFRVRVAALRSRARGGGDQEAAGLLRRIREVAVQHQEQFGAVFREQIVPALAADGIRLTDGSEAEGAYRDQLRDIFQEEVAPQLQPVVLRPDVSPFLRNRAIYLVVELLQRGSGGAGTVEYGLVEIPSQRVPRFLSLDVADGSTSVLFLDDLIRLHLGELFPAHEVRAAHAIKISRDAELYLEEELADSVAEAVRRSLRKRESGLPTRFLFDKDAPGEMIEFLKECFGLAQADLVLGGRYHNLHDLHTFPRCGRSALASPPLEVLAHPALDQAGPLLDAVAERDFMVHLPYHSYGYVLRFLQEAAADPRVEELWITLYRVAPESEVVGALVDAARTGKRVTAFIEVQARFDEAANLAWAERLEAAGVRTIYSIPGLKVHAKLVLATLRDGSSQRALACLCTGNFNERTARIYTDHALLTGRPELAEEVGQLFRFLAGETPEPQFHHLLVAPRSLRPGLEALVQREMKHAAAGRAARIVLKMNSLEDPGMIEALYRASAAGVEVELIVRGICCLAAGVPGLSENISARSIVDRYLEHGRIFVFHNGGEELCYLASADWMVRNLSRRVEVAFPILDEQIRQEILDLLRLQLADNTKSRILDPEMQNHYWSAPGSARRSQVEIHRKLAGAARRAEPSVPAPVVARAKTT